MRDPSAQAVDSREVEALESLAQDVISWFQYLGDQGSKWQEYQTAGAAVRVRYLDILRRSLLESSAICRFKRRLAAVGGAHFR